VQLAWDHITVSLLIIIKKKLAEVQTGYIIPCFSRTAKYSHKLSSGMQERGFHLQMNTNITAIILMRVIPVVLIQYVIIKQSVYVKHFIAVV